MTSREWQNHVEIQSIEFQARKQVQRQWRVSKLGGKNNRMFGKCNKAGKRDSTM